MTTQVNHFYFENKSLRTHLIDNQLWFIAKDVCDALKISNSRKALTALDEDEKGVTLSDTLKGRQKMAIVSESGMYTLILRCRDAVKKGSVPHRFRKWVTSEVLPSIRKTGTYTKKTTTDERTPLRDAINMLVGKKGLLYPEAYSLIHQRFNVSHIDELEQSQLPVAVEYVHRLVLEGELLERDSASSEPSEREKLAYNVSALATHFEVIYEAWNERILPVLNSMESPLAGRLVSRFTHCDTFMMFVKRSAERQLRKGEVARII